MMNSEIVSKLGSVSLNKNKCEMHKNECENDMTEKNDIESVSQWVRHKRVNKRTLASPTNSESRSRSRSRNRQ